MTEPTPDRVRVHFDPDGGKPREVRVPAGATLFDAASWNGCTVEGGNGPSFPRKRPTDSPTPFAN